MINRIPWWIRIPVLFFLIFGLVEYFVDSGDQPVFIAYPISQLFFLMVLLLLIAIELIHQSIEKIMLSTLSEEAREKYYLEKNKPLEFKWINKIYKKLTRSKSVEKEGEIILDHNYDGIKELDNVLPPWWVYGFYVTIFFAVIYLIRFHIVKEYTQAEEYEIELAEAKMAIEEYKKTAKDLIDASTVELLTDASDLSAGKKIFETSCVACHMADGGGGIGPNLTDEYWILGGGIKNVFKTVSEGGRDGKGMVAWKASLKPSEIAQVASYVLQFQGTTPANPKAAEGDFYGEEKMNTQEDEEPMPEELEQAKDSATVVMN